jgi:hypothetical protein
VALWTVAAEYQPLDWPAVALGVVARAHRSDVQDGTTVENTGGFVLGAVPAIDAKVIPGGSVLAEDQVRSPPS